MGLRAPTREARSNTRERRGRTLPAASFPPCPYLARMCIQAQSPHQAACATCCRHDYFFLFNFWMQQKSSLLMGKTLGIGEVLVPLQYPSSSSSAPPLLPLAVSPHAATHPHPPRPFRHACVFHEFEFVAQVRATWPFPPQILVVGQTTFFLLLFLRSLGVGTRHFHAPFFLLLSSIPPQFY